VDVPGHSYITRFNTTEDPSDLIDAMIFAGFVEGREPFSITAKLQRVRPDAELVPPGVSPAWRSCEPSRWTQVARGQGWTLRASRWRDSTANVVVTATSEELARTVLAQATEGMTEPPPAPDDATSIGFWHLGPHSPERVVRTIATTPWPRIRRNYASAVVPALDRLMDLSPDRLAGRLLLLHGPPGTGKTTVLRALANAWRQWCAVDYVLDPERLLGESSYLMEAVLSEDDVDDGLHEIDVTVGCNDSGAPRRAKRWRLLVLEDCDELISANAKQSSGLALARLLNLTDGIVGQGLEALVCITTNEELTRLHPAIVRPGRCLAHIHIGPMPQDEAGAWLGNGHHVGGDGATLAELFALRGDLTQVEKEEELRPSSQYL
jgi:hypothetical protein